MNQPDGIYATLANWVLAGVTTVIGAFFVLIRWIYVRDAEKIDSALAGVKADHESLMAIVTEINATRPLRTELVDAVEGLRQETNQGFGALRNELRTDIGALREDVTTRLDTLIRMQSGK